MKVKGVICFFLFAQFLKGQVFVVAVVYACFFFLKVYV